MNIGFIGLGNMGGRMVNNLLKAGCDLTVNDISKDIARPYLEQGAKWADTPKALAEACTLVITMLPGPPEIEHVFYGPDGLMAGLKKGDIYVDMSTSLPSLTRKMSQDAEPKGITVMDAPVTGGTERAAEAALTIMVGGNEAAFQKITETMGHMGTKVIHMGEVGCGHVTKLANNLIAMSSTFVSAEALILGVKGGVDARKLWEVCTSGSGDNFMLNKVWPMTIMKGDFEARFELGLAAKDIHLANQLAREYMLPLPIAALLEQSFIECKAEGLAKKDLGSHILKLERLSGVEVRFPKEEK